MKAKDITLGGIMVALTCIVLYLTLVIPTNTVTILTIASAIIPVVIIRSNVKTAIFVFIASSILSFFIVPINISMLYIIFFGLYGIIKYFVERINKISIEYIVKLIYFNVAFILGFYILQIVLGLNLLSGFQQLLSKFLSSSNETLVLLILWIVVQPIFLIFDYALTLIITFYLDKFHKKI